MKETIKQFTADLLKDFKASLVKNQPLLSEIKASADAGSFKVIVSTSDEDRQGDELDQTKWKLNNYEANPVVLWAHHYDEPPIGVCTSISVQNGQLVAEGKFAPAELNPFAAQIAAMYEAGFIKATSVGFMQHEDGDLELLEFSFVPVPANPYALSMRQVKELNLNIPQLVMKGLTFETKSEQIGDSCEGDDGTPGILAEDPDNPGHVVCVPGEGGKSKSNENDGDMNNELTKNLKAEHGRHSEAVAKSIDEFKSLDEFKAALGTENDSHLEKCMKAIDENYELEDQKKSVDEFKTAMKAEHGEHVKCFDKAIEEFKSIDEFEKSASAELDRHQKAQMDLCKAEMGEGEADGKAAIQIEQKSGRAISAANKEKIKAVIKSIEDSHAAHGVASNNVIAALKDLMGPEGNEGEEHKDAPEPPAEPVAPKPKVEVRDSRPADETFEVFMANRRVLRTVDAAVGKALEDLNKNFQKLFPARR